VRNGVEVESEDMVAVAEAVAGEAAMGTGAEVVVMAEAEAGVVISSKEFLKEGAIRVRQLPRLVKDRPTLKTRKSKHEQ
jgi:hypothetical protein